MCEEGKEEIETVTTLKWSKPVVALLLVVVNAANEYLVPLVASAPLGPQVTGGLQLFLTAILNGVVVFLATESSGNTGGTPPPN